MYDITMYNTCNIAISIYQYILINYTLVIYIYILVYTSNTTCITINNFN